MNEIIKTLKAIIADLERQIGKINVATDKVQFEILSRAKNLLMLFVQLLEKGTINFVLNFLTTKILHDEEQGVATTLNDQGLRFIQALYDGCETKPSNANADYDGIRRILLTLHKHIESIVNVVKDHTPLNYRLFKNKILERLNHISMLFYVLAMIRKFNIQNPSIGKLINFIEELKKKAITEPQNSLSCLLDISAAQLRQHIQLVSQEQQFYYFNFDRRLGDSFEFSCVFQLLQFLRAKIRQPYKVGLFLPNPELMDAINSCYEQMLNRYREEETLLSTSKNKIEIMIKYLQQLSVELTKGAKKHFKEKNSSLEDQIILSRLPLLHYRLDVAVRLPASLKTMLFCTAADAYGTLTYDCGIVQKQALTNNLMTAEVSDIKMILIDLYELTVNKNHPFKLTFKEIFAHGAAKDITEQALDLLIRANINQMLGITQEQHHSSHNIDQNKNQQLNSK